MINVFPNPLKYVEQKGQFSFQDRVVLTIGKSFSNQEFLRLCPELWNQFTAGKSNLEIVITDLDNCASLSTAGVSLDAPLLQDYEYTLRISEEGAAVRYRDDNGFIHGFCTLLQLLSPYHRKANNFTVECCEVFDSPALEFRGVHFCVFPEFSLLFLKKMIRLCGLMKVSHVILEFFGMYRYGCFPYLGWPIAYTREELEPLIADGKAFGIEFIPMFNHIGHATQSRFKAGKSVVLDQAATIPLPSATRNTLSPADGPGTCETPRCLSFRKWPGRNCVICLDPVSISISAVMKPMSGIIGRILWTKMIMRTLFPMSIG